MTDEVIKVNDTSKSNRESQATELNTDHQNNLFASPVRGDTAKQQQLKKQDDSRTDEGSYYGDTPTHPQETKQSVNRAIPDAGAAGADRDKLVRSGEQPTATTARSLEKPGSQTQQDVQQQPSKLAPIENKSVSVPADGKVGTSSNNLDRQGIVAGRESSAQQGVSQQIASSREVQSAPAKSSDFTGSERRDVPQIRQVVASPQTLVESQNKEGPVAAPKLPASGMELAKSAAPSLEQPPQYRQPERTETRSGNQGDGGAAKHAESSSSKSADSSTSRPADSGASRSANAPAQNNATSAGDTHTQHPESTVKSSIYGPAVSAANALSGQDAATVYGAVKAAEANTANDSRSIKQEQIAARTNPDSRSTAVESSPAKQQPVTAGHDQAGSSDISKGNIRSDYINTKGQSVDVRTGAGNAGLAEPGHTTAAKVDEIIRSTQNKVDAAQPPKGPTIDGRTISQDNAGGKVNSADVGGKQSAETTGRMPGPDVTGHSPSRHPTGSGGGATDSSNTKSTAFTSSTDSRGATGTRSEGGSGGGSSIQMSDRQPSKGFSVEDGVGSANRGDIKTAQAVDGKAQGTSAVRSEGGPPGGSGGVSESASAGKVSPFGTTGSATGRPESGIATGSGGSHSGEKQPSTGYSIESGASVRPETATTKLGVSGEASATGRLNDEVRVSQPNKDSGALAGSGKPVDSAGLAVSGKSSEPGALSDAGKPGRIPLPLDSGHSDTTTAAGNKSTARFENTEIRSGRLTDGNSVSPPGSTNTPLDASGRRVQIVAPGASAGAEPTGPTGVIPGLLDKGAKGSRGQPDSGARGVGGSGKSAGSEIPGGSVAFIPASKLPLPGGSVDTAGSVSKDSGKQPAHGGLAEIAGSGGKSGVGPSKGEHGIAPDRGSQSQRSDLNSNIRSDSDSSSKSNRPDSSQKERSPHLEGTLRQIATSVTGSEKGMPANTSSPDQLGKLPGDSAVDVSGKRTEKDQSMQKSPSGERIPFYGQGPTTLPLGSREVPAMGSAASRTDSAGLEAAAGSRGSSKVSGGDQRAKSTDKSYQSDSAVNVGSEDVANIMRGDALSQPQEESAEGRAEEKSAGDRLSKRDKGELLVTKQISEEYARSKTGIYEYRTRAGDTLYRVATDVLGDSNLIPLLVEHDGTKEFIRWCPNARVLLFSVDQVVRLPLPTRIAEFHKFGPSQATLQKIENAESFPLFDPNERSHIPDFARLATLDNRKEFALTWLMRARISSAQFGLYSYVTKPGDTVCDVACNTLGDVRLADLIASLPMNEQFVSKKPQVDSFVLTPGVNIELPLPRQVCEFLASVEADESMST
jgi:hypothetical protein